MHAVVLIRPQLIVSWTFSCFVSKTAYSYAFIKTGAREKPTAAIVTLIRPSGAP